MVFLSLHFLELFSPRPTKYINVFSNLIRKLIELTILFRGPFLTDRSG